MADRRKPRCVVCGRYCSDDFAEVFVRTMGYAAHVGECRDRLVVEVEGAMATLLERFAGERKRARRR